MEKTLTEERAEAYARQENSCSGCSEYHGEYCPCGLYKTSYDRYITIAQEAVAIYRHRSVKIVKKLVDELQTSKNYHLGITGLDSPEEIEQKQREHETALIRGINRVLEEGRQFLEENGDN